MKEATYVDLIHNGEVASSLTLNLQTLTSVCHGIAVEGGWWDRKGAAKVAHDLRDDPNKASEYTNEMLDLLDTVADEPRNPLELIALIHSEASEALEGVRKGLMDDHLPHHKMETVELADIVVRVLDYAGGRGLDVGSALVEKLQYNTKRADHKPENRAADGGKKY